VKALARSALTEVATGLSRLGCLVDANIYLLANTRPCTWKKKLERDFGARFISFFKKKENLSFGILLGHKTRKGKQRRVHVLTSLHSKERWATNGRLSCVTLRPLWGAGWLATWGSKRIRNQWHWHWHIMTHILKTGTTTLRFEASQR
jgi:hypothetical protein